MSPIALSFNTVPVADSLERADGTTMASPEHHHECALLDTSCTREDVFCLADDLSLGIGI